MNKNKEEIISDALDSKNPTTYLLNKADPKSPFKSGSRLTKRYDLDESTYIYLISKDMLLADKSNIEEVIISDKPLRIVKDSDLGAERLDNPDARRISLRKLENGDFDTKILIPLTLPRGTVNIGKVLTPKILTIINYFLVELGKDDRKVKEANGKETEDNCK